MEDVLRGLAAQDWCTGRIGATGVSWGGFAPCSWPCAGRRDLGGHRADPLVARPLLHRRALRRRHAALRRAPWSGRRRCWRRCRCRPLRRMVGDAGAGGDVAGAAGGDAALALRVAAPPAPRRLLAARLAVRGLGAIEVPVLAIGGWLDGYRDACLELLRHGRMPRRAVIGPVGPRAPAPRLAGAGLGPPPGARALVRRAGCATTPTAWTRSPCSWPTCREGQPREPHPEHVPGRWRAWRALAARRAGRDAPAVPRPRRRSHDAAAGRRRTTLDLGRAALVRRRVGARGGAPAARRAAAAPTCAPTTPAR